MLQDVTEQEKLEQARREFVANVSHELRTPLTTIKSYLEALDDGAMEEPQLAQHFIGVMRSETERMIRLVTDLLHLSRLDSKQAQHAPRHGPICREMLEEVADRFSFQLQQKSISVTVRIGGRRSRRCWLDRDQIDQVLDNLVSNAIKYTLDGGPSSSSARQRWQPDSMQSPLRIPASASRRGTWAAFSTGSIGWTKPARATWAARASDLSIAREIIRAHGGTISLESELNEGTTVTVVLPLNEEVRRHDREDQDDCCSRCSCCSSLVQSYLLAFHSNDFRQSCRKNIRDGNIGTSLNAESCFTRNRSCCIWSKKGTRCCIPIIISINASLMI